MMKSVLIVDDDPGFRGLVHRIILALGLEVAGEADTVAGALTAAAKLHPEAVLIDVGLPDGDGASLAAEITALPWRPRVVLTSSDPDAVDADRAEQVGAIGFVPKCDLTNGSLLGMLTGA